MCFTRAALGEGLLVFVRFAESRNTPTFANLLFRWGCAEFLLLGPGSNSAIAVSSVSPFLLPRRMNG